MKKRKVVLKLNFARKYRKCFRLLIARLMISSRARNRNSKMNNWFRTLVSPLKVLLKMIKNYKKFSKSLWMNNINWCWKNFSSIMYLWNRMAIHYMPIMIQPKLNKIPILQRLKCKKLPRTLQLLLIRLSPWSLPTLFLSAATPRELM